MSSPTGSSFLGSSYHIPFAILRVVFTYFSLNDHDPSGAVTRVQKEPLSKLKDGEVTGYEP